MIILFDEWEDMMYWLLMISTFLLSYAITENLYLRRKIKRLKPRADRYTELVNIHMIEKYNETRPKDQQLHSGHTDEAQP